MRGEHPGRCRLAHFVLGSSPLARGAQRDERRDDHRRGIIPACAGSTFGRQTRAGSHSDHPRLRGEHWSSLSATVDILGSSPLARGALGLPREMCHDPGIIPACAGSTRTRRLSARSGRDHPRLRGEHEVGLIALCGMTGSSPLARGAPSKESGLHGFEGIIPACAGSTVQHHRVHIHS